MNVTLCPTKTTSSIVTPSQMKVWLEILQRGPILAPLDFNENANFRFVADLASVKVHKPTDPNIPSELYVGRYKLMRNSFPSHAPKPRKIKSPKAGSITGALSSLDAPLIYRAFLLLLFFPSARRGW